MLRNPPDRSAPRARFRTAGFTLIELCVTVVILGILMAIGIVNFGRFRNRASYSSCVSNQRHILEGTLLYISAASPGTVTFDVDVLVAANYVGQQVADCPHSTIDDFKDYTIEITNNQVTALTCKIEPVEHAWTLP